MLNLKNLHSKNPFYADLTVHYGAKGYHPSEQDQSGHMMYVINGGSRVLVMTDQPVERIMDFTTDPHTFADMVWCETSTGHRVQLPAQHLKKAK